MPFKELLPPPGPTTTPRRTAGIAVAGSVPPVELACAGGALSQLEMSFNEFCNFCVGEAKALAPLATLDWIGGGDFVLCLAGEPALAAAFCRAFAAHRPEFARVHRWPAAIVLGVAAGELVFSHSGADGRRGLRAFGEAIARARQLAAVGVRLAARADAPTGLKLARRAGDADAAFARVAGDAPPAAAGDAPSDLVICAPELEALFHAELAEGQGESKLRVQCASA